MKEVLVSKEIEILAKELELEFTEGELSYDVLNKHLKENHGIYIIILPDAMDENDTWLFFYGINSTSRSSTGGYKSRESCINAALYRAFKLLGIN